MLLRRRPGTSGWLTLRTALRRFGSSGVCTTRLATVRRSWSTYATGCSASSALADCPAEPRAVHPSTARPSRDCPRSRGTFIRSSDSRPYAGERASRLRRVLARTRRQGDNDGMASDDSKALMRLVCMNFLDGGRPSGTRGWVNPVAPVVTQAVAGAGHWAAGRRQRALAEWAGAAGFGLVAWGLGTEAPTGAEMLENMAALAGMEGQRRDFLRKLAAEAPATAAT